jgi:hypothetical protein
VNNAASFASQPTLQPPPTQQDAQVQIGSGEQAQAHSNSSQTSDNGESEVQKVSVTQIGQAIEQVFESSKLSEK